MKHCIKKLFTFLLALMAGTGILFAESGTCGAEGDNLTWEFTDGVLTISGTGAMADWAKAYETPWYAVRSTIESVVIEDGITNIGNNAFSSCKALTSVTIPNSVTGIGDYAFKECNALASVSLGSSVTTIGSQAFNYCISLTSIDIPNSVTSIGNYAFIDCEALTSVKIGDGVISIGKETFQNCKALTSVTIGNSVTDIGGSAFAWCSSLTSVEIPNSVKTIGDYAFQYCENLSSVTIPNGIESIGEYAFRNCRLKSVTIPNSVTNIGICAFASNSLLKEINVESDNPDFSSVDGVVFNKDQTALLVYPTNKGVYTIPNSVISIGDYAFAYSAIKTLTIHSNLFEIGNYAFCNCGVLGLITCRAQIPPVCGEACFSNAAKFRLDVPAESVEGYKYTAPWSYYASSVNAIPEIPVSGTCGDNLTWTLDENGVLTISGKGKMDNWKDNDEVPWIAHFGSYLDFIDSVAIEEGVTSIGSNAFIFCDIEAVTIPNSVQTIGKDAFGFCDALNSVNFGSGLRTIEEKAFEECSSLGSVTLPQGVTTINNYTFQSCSNLTSVKINGDVKSIGIYAFNSCTQLAEFDIPATVTEIGKYAFSGCSSLTSVTIPEGMKHIADGTFDGCSALTSVTIPAGVGIQTNTNNIGERAFYNCKGLQSVTCNAVTPPVCGTDAFYGVSSYTNLYVPSESEEAYKNTAPWKNFNVIAIPVPYGTCGDNITWNVTDSVLTISGTGAMDCSAPWTFYNTSIKSLVIEEGVTQLGPVESYNGCTNLSTVTLSSTVTDFGYASFQQCPALTSFEVADDNPTFCAIDGVLFSKDKTVLVQYPVGHKRTEYIIPATVDSIGTLAFSGCTNLTSVTIPESVTKIGQLAFYNCTGLKTIICEASTPPVCSEFCYFTDFCFPWCFEGVDKESAIVYVPKGAIEAYQAAEEWSDFKNIQASPLIGQGICGAEGNNLIWKLMNDGVLTISGTGDMADNVSSWIPFRADILSVVIEDGATGIGDEAFADCANLLSVTVPNSVTRIGSSAFSGCVKLSDFIIPARVTTIGKYAFSGCAALTTMEIPDRVTQIGEKAFNNCSGLTSISCIGAPAACGEDCFAGVDKSIPLSVPQEYMEDYKKAKEWKDFHNIKGVMCSIDSGTFGDTGKFKWRLTCSGKLIIEGTGGIAHGSPDAPWKEYASSVRLIELSEGITDIGGGGGYDVFGNLENLESISLPSTLTAIKNAFNNNPQLATLSIPNKVKEIDISFNGCPGLNIVVFGYSLQKLHDSFMGSLATNSDVVCLAVTPPGELQNSFKGGDPSALYVPAESVSEYEANHAGWGYFTIWPLSSRPGTHIIASGTAGNGINWELDSNGILTIKGKGDMDSWGIPAPASVGKRYIPTSDPTAPWYPYHSDILYVVIEGGITTIGNNAFYGCTDIQSITCYATTPPACGEGAFGGIDPSIPLNVPENAVEAYQGANQWKEFDVQADENQSPTAIDKVQSDNVPCTKVLRNGQLYLLYDGHIFDVRGQIVE